MQQSDKIQKTLDIKYGEWWQNEILMKNAKKQHSKNIDSVLSAIQYYHKKNRPIEILVIHGSSRSNNQLSCAHELSNSQMVLESGLDALQDIKMDINVERINLREYNIEACNNCVSTCSALCGFPCNCFPFDPMQKIYPLVLKADIILMSTGVNQAAMSTRLKAFCDRLISLDGGFFVDKDQFMVKDSNWRDKCLEISASGNFEYNQRMFGKVCAYFISSKDQTNIHDVKQGVNYGKMVAESLMVGFDGYGCKHPDPYYVVASTKWDEDYMYDKENLNNQTELHKKSKKMIESCIKLHMKLKKNPPKFNPGRKLRT